MVKPTNIVDYRKLDLKTLDRDLQTARLKLQDLRNQLVIGKLKDHNQLRQLRRSIAQMATVRNEKIILEAISHGQD